MATTSAKLRETQTGQDPEKHSGRATGSSDPFILAYAYVAYRAAAAVVFVWTAPKSLSYAFSSFPSPGGRTSMLLCSAIYHGFSVLARDRKLLKFS